MNGWTFFAPAWLPCCECMPWIPAVTKKLISDKQLTLVLLSSVFVPRSAAARNNQKRFEKIKPLAETGRRRNNGCHCSLPPSLISKPGCLCGAALPLFVAETLMTKVPSVGNCKVKHEAAGCNNGSTCVCVAESNLYERTHEKCAINFQTPR